MEGLVTGLARELGAQGLLGVLLVLVGAFAFYCLRSWMACAEARIEDGKQNARVITELNTTLSSISTTLASLAQAEAASARVVEASAKQTVTDDERARERLDAIDRKMDELRDKLSETKHTIANAITAAMGRERGGS